MSFGGRAQFTATVVGASSNAVTWSVKEGSAGGSISATGLYTAPSRSGTFHVLATSTADPALSGSANVTTTSPPGTPPVLTAGTWTDLSPAVPLLGKNYGIPWVEIDPSRPTTIYLCIDQSGMWKTMDGGTTWARLGSPTASGNTAQKTSYLDSPIAVRVDPHDSSHLYATQGVRGTALGFWVSTDGGSTWAWPPGYASVVKMVGTSDVTQFDVDPSDFRHIVLGSHGPWKGMSNAGLLESTDGGGSWTVHAPVSTWASGSMGVHFLYNPALGLGTAQTWLVSEASFWRTTDSGANWTKVSSQSSPHGGNDIYYTKAGVLYAGASSYPVRSMDNGATWQQLTKGPGDAYYYSVQGDGMTLYTQRSYTGTNSGNVDGGGATPSPYLSSPEADGQSWTPFQNGVQKFVDGPFIMRFDPGNRIMYSANWDAGFWALKVNP